jgi:integration host factor subunit alpha
MHLVVGTRQVLADDGDHGPIRVSNRPDGQPAQPFDTDGISGERSHMTKADIVDIVYEKVGGFSKKEAIDIVETVFETAKTTLEKGDKLKISGFGNFVVRDKKARPGRNPQTGKEITISARRVLTFKASLVLTKALNS